MTPVVSILLAAVIALMKQARPGDILQYASLGTYKDKNGKEIANYSFYEIRDENGKRVTLEPSATADVMLVYPQGKYDLTDANFDHLDWHYSYSYRKQK